MIDIHINGIEIVAALVGCGASLGIGMIGGKGVEAIGRNPGAFGLVMGFGLLSIAFAEGLAILAYFVFSH